MNANAAEFAARAHPEPNPCQAHIMETIPMTMQRIIHAAQAGMRPPQRDRLSWPESKHASPAFNRLAHTDFAILSESDDRLDWDDYCPAYALGLLSFESYCCDSSRHSEAALQAQWNDVRGSSRLEWEQARTIIARSWNALSHMQQIERLCA